MSMNLLKIAHRSRVDLITGLLFVVLATYSQAATFTVNSPGDSHDVSPGDGIAADHTDPDSSYVTLRCAVEEASALAGPDTILVSPSISPIRLSLGPVVIAGDQTCLRGSDSLPVIDGLGNPLAVPSIIVASDSSSITGFLVKRSRGHGMVITGAHNTVARCTVIGNGIDNDLFAGIAVTGATAYGNRIAGSLIGVVGNGATIDGNPIGVLFDQEANGNLVGGETEASRNIISGNESSGIVITGGAAENAITGNYVGPDITGTLVIGGQHTGIFLTNGAHDNRIGSGAWPAGNLISGNVGDGVALAGPDVRSNVVCGNVIGMNAVGRLRLANGGDGIAVTDGASDNRIGDPELDASNFISGNSGSGVHIAGWQSDGNNVAGNVIGLDIRGYRVVGNGGVDGAGVLIEDSARNTTVGGATESERNVISGNARFGVHIRGSGTDFNVVSGNYVGPDPLGTSYGSNAAGVVVSDGAQSNLIGGSEPLEGNVISGNRGESFPDGAGVILTGAGTSRNRVSGNIIGLDASGARVLPNGLTGVLVGDGASENVIGGRTVPERNVITGNGTGPFVPGVSGGVHIYGVGTTHNDVVGNYIGLTANGTSALGNYGSNVGVHMGAGNNRIGGDSVTCGNVITEAETHGIVVDGPTTVANLIRYNRIYDNDSLGIKLTNSANGGILPPVLLEATSSQVNGIGAPVGGRVDIYRAAPDLSGCGEAYELVGSGTAQANGSFSAALHGVEPGDTLTAVATDSRGSSSAFSLNIVADPTSAVDDDPVGLPAAFALSQNFPNPFNPETTIRYALPTAGRVDLRIYNALGQPVASLIGQAQPAGWHEIRWAGLTDDGRPVASGVYFYRLEAGAFRDTRKMILVK